MELDTSWITNFEQLEKEYNIFYKDKVTKISSFSIYINRDNDIVKIKKDKITNMINNTVNKNNILYQIKNNNTYNYIKYKLISILKYNIDIDTLDINNFLRENTEISNSKLENFNNIQSSYLNIVENINDIRFKNTINIFQDINAIFFIYYNNLESNQNQNHTNRTMNTKKVYINYKKKRKTKRK